MHPRASRLFVSLAVAVLARVASAQEVLEDQDPIDPDWAPAWDEPFWPVPTGALLEIAAGHNGGRVPLPLGGSGLDGPGFDGTGRTASGDYVLALLTLPLAGPARPPVQGDAEGSDGTDADADPVSEEARTAPVSARRPSTAASVADPGLGQNERSQAATVGEGPADAEPGQPPAPGRAQEMSLSLLQDAVDQAEKAAGFGSALRSLASIKQRARWSGLAPELRLRGATGIDQTRSVDSAGLVPSDETLRDGSDSLVEIRLTFHLEKLLHSGQEAGLARARQQLLAERSELRSVVGRQLALYVRARRQLELAFLDDEERQRSELLAEQARFDLYLLTGGWFRGEETLRRYGASQHDETQELAPGPRRPTAVRARGAASVAP